MADVNEVIQKFITQEETHKTLQTMCVCPRMLNLSPGPDEPKSSV